MSGVFTITQVQRTGNGAYVDTSTRFSWTAAEFSAPRGPWHAGMHLRTVREDYPGADGNPQEQVLGWNFKPFTIKGVWDDRYMGSGNAIATWEKAKQVFKTGTLVRVEFERVAFICLVTDFDWDYKRIDFISYEFQFSPHRDELTAIFGPVVTPLISPATYNYRAAVLRNDMRDVCADFSAYSMVLDTFEAVALLVETLSTEIDRLATIIDQRLYLQAEPIEAMARIAQAFSSVKTAAKNLRDACRDLDAEDVLIIATAGVVLDFHVWSCGLEYQAQLVIKECLEAQAALEAQRIPETAALYRPYEGESLYAISQRFYGTTGNWRKIMEANGIDSTVLTGEELLIIPQGGG